MTPKCPCGGDTYVDEFAFPGRPVAFFLRCEHCGAAGDNAETREAAATVAIRPDQRVVQ